MGPGQFGVAGKFQTEIPLFGTLLAWGRTHVLPVAAISQPESRCCSIPLRRKKLAPHLAASIAVAHKEPRMGPIRGEFAVLTLCSLGTVLALLFVAAWLRTCLWTFPGAAALGALSGRGGFTVHLLYKFGWEGVDEPQKSRIALAGRLYSVQDFPGSNRPPLLWTRQWHSTASLRSTDCPYYHADPTKAGEAFLLITVQRRSSGRHSRPRRGGTREQVIPTLQSVQARVRAAHAAPDVTVTRQLVAEARPPVRTHRRPGSSWRATAKTSRPRPSHAG